jgi:hypothetical protein
LRFFVKGFISMALIFTEKMGKRDMKGNPLRQSRKGVRFFRKLALGKLALMEVTSGT